MVDNDTFELDIAKQLTYQFIFIFIFLSIIFDDSLLSAICFLCLGILISLFISLRKKVKQIVYILIILYFSILALLSYVNDISILNNLFYNYMKDFIFLKDLENYDLYLRANYTDLTIISIIITLSFAILIYYKKIKTSAKKDLGVFGKLLNEFKLKRLIYIISFLIIASFYEELLYRYFIINILVEFQIPLIIVIIISGIIFGYDHFKQGGILLMTNSIFAGIIFANMFLNFGIIGSWILHFLWNGIIFIETIIYKLISEKNK